MKILVAIDLNFSYTSGCSVFAHKLAYALIERGHEVAMILPSERHAHTLSVEQGLAVYGIPSLPMPFERKLRFCLPHVWNRKIAAVLDEFQPDVIHFQNHYGVNRSVLALAQKRKIGSLATNHFVPDNLFAFFPFTHLLSRLLGRLAWRDFAGIYRRMQVVTSPSQRAASLIEPLLLEKRVLAVSCGIDVNRFRPGIDGTDLRDRFHIPSGTTFLYVGRVDSEKKLDVLVKATAKAQGAGEFHLVVAGRGGDLPRLKRLARRLGIAGRITFTGFVPDADLPALYNIADCFVIPSTAELQSIVTLEAMACGLPVIAADSIALPELVHDGVNGLLFDPGNVEMLAQKMVALSRSASDMRDMGRESLKLIEDHDHVRTVERFEQLYRELTT
jgi:glycosyltransferase involved in cell wall biosynthesis